VRHQQLVLVEDGEGEEDDEYGEDEEDVSSEEDSSEDDKLASPETSEGQGTEDLGDDLPEDRDDDDTYTNPRNPQNYWKRVNLRPYDEDESSEDDTLAGLDTSEGLSIENLGDDLLEDSDDDDDYTNPRNPQSHWNRVNLDSYHQNHPELGEEFEIRKNRVKEMVQAVPETIVKYVEETPFLEDSGVSFQNWIYNGVQRL
jgi:hypothetical protein